MACTKPLSGGLPLKKPKIQSLDIWNKTVIVTTCKVQQGDVYCYLQKKLRGREFAKGSIFKIYAGAHGYSDGRLGDRKSDHKQLNDDTKSQIKDVLEDARDDKMEHEDIEVLGEAIGERIMENVESKDLISHMRNALNIVKEEEREIIQEMKYLLPNPTPIGKDSQDEELECNHEDTFVSDFLAIVESKRPYVIFLAFCLTDRNELTTYMRELGIIAASTMKNDIGEITKGRWFALNEDQREILEQVQDYHRDRKVEKGKHVLLCGGPGTGKTILVSETFKMRVEHCKRMMKKGEKPLRIIIVVWCLKKTDPLFQRTKNEYFTHLKEGTDEHGNKIEFHTCDTLTWGSTSLSSLEDYSVEHLGPGELRNIAREFSCPDMWSKTLIYIDEFKLKLEIGLGQKFQNFQYEFNDIGNNVDVFVAVCPWVDDEEYKKYNVALPEQSSVLAKQLHQMHRNGMKIHYLLRHISIKRSHGILHDEHDTIAKTLPDSEITVWVSLGSDFPLPLVLSLIDDKYIRCDQKVTVVTESGKCMTTAKQWCEKDEKKTFVKIMDGYAHNIVGYEDDVMIYIDCPPQLPQEMLSRARDRLIIVTTPDGKDRLDWKWGCLFNVSGLINHENGDCPLGDQCPSKQSPLLKIVDLKLPAMRQRITAIDVNAKDEFGMTKLHLSSLLGEHEKVKDLVENPAVNVNEDFNGMTPLHMAAYGCHVNVVKILLWDCRVDSSQKDSWGKSAIDLARERELHHQGLANESEYWLGLYMRSYTRDYEDDSYDAYDRERTRKLADEYKEEFEGHKNMVLRCKEIQKKLTTH